MPIRWIYPVGIILMGLALLCLFLVWRSRDQEAIPRDGIFNSDVLRAPSLSHESIIFLHDNYLYVCTIDNDSKKLEVRRTAHIEHLERMQGHGDYKISFLQEAGESDVEVIFVGDSFYVSESDTKRIGFSGAIRQSIQRDGEIYYRFMTPRGPILKTSLWRH